MKLNAESLQNRKAWTGRGVSLPAFDYTEMAEKTKAAPVWVHFGAGNIFRGFIAALGQELLNQGASDHALSRLRRLTTTLLIKFTRPMTIWRCSSPSCRTARRRKKVIASIAEGVKANLSDADAAARLRAIFRDPGLQMASFTITEKGYALTDMAGAFFPFVKADLEKGPAHATHAMSVVTALLYERYRAGRFPISMVSMDNCS